MSLNRNQVNPLGVFDKRKLSWMPLHFSKITLEDLYLDVCMIESWILYNLNSRYAIIFSQGLDEKRKFIQVISIGFEDQKELTMFNLGCQYLHKGN